MVTRLSQKEKAVEDAARFLDNQLRKDASLIVPPSMMLEIKKG
jgi:hypothetical protein